MLSRRAVLAVPGLAAAWPWAASANQARLVERLRAGGFNIFFRHSLTMRLGQPDASPYCRCVDTARLAFGRVEIAPWLETDGDDSGAPERARLVRLRDALSQSPARGVNDVFVAHGNNLAGLARLHGYPALPIEEAEAVIFRPGTSPASVLARRTGAQWLALGGV
jgi:hypothetical protein